jgi:selT/selW/selH-like putative selenoprotein
MHHNFPELEGKVTGANLPPPPIVELLMKLLSFVQLAGLVVVVLGRNAFSLIGFTTVPSWYYGVEKNGVQLAIFLYLLLPQILSKYTVSGSFEVELDGVVIFSKLQTGRLPQYADLVDPLVQAGLRLINSQD